MILNAVCTTSTPRTSEGQSFHSFSSILQPKAATDVSPILFTDVDTERNLDYDSQSFYVTVFGFMASAMLPPRMMIDLLALLMGEVLVGK